MELFSELPDKLNSDKSLGMKFWAVPKLFSPLPPRPINVCYAAGFHSYHSYKAVGFKGYSRLGEGDGIKASKNVTSLTGFFLKFCRFS